MLDRAFTTILATELMEFFGAFGLERRLLLNGNTAVDSTQIAIQRPCLDAVMAFGKCRTIGLRSVSKTPCTVDFLLSYGCNRVPAKQNPLKTEKFEQSSFDVHWSELRVRLEGASANPENEETIYAGG